jgi:hypothetical protein
MRRKLKMRYQPVRARASCFPVQTPAQSPKPRRGFFTQAIQRASASISGLFFYDLARLSCVVFQRTCGAHKSAQALPFGLTGLVARLILSGPDRGDTQSPPRVQGFGEGRRKALFLRFGTKDLLKN